MRSLGEKYPRGKFFTRKKPPKEDICFGNSSIKNIFPKDKFPWGRLLQWEILTPPTKLIFLPHGTQIFHHWGGLITFRGHLL
jgi:hypothetical protein